jgi:hypothetical protein
MNGDGSGYYGAGAVYLAGRETETPHYRERNGETAVGTEPIPWSMYSRAFSQKT